MSKTTTYPRHRAKLQLLQPPLPHSKVGIDVASSTLRRELICSCQNKLLFLHFVVSFSEKMSRMVLFLLILLKVSQSITAQSWQISSTQMYFLMSFNLLSNIWLKCGARIDPQAEIDQKP